MDTKSPTEPPVTEVYNDLLQQPKPSRPPKRPYAPSLELEVQPVDDQSQRKRARLTRKNLALFDKMEGKKASAPLPGSTRSSSTTSKTTSTTMSGFAVQARNNGILDPRCSKPPSNLEDIHRQHVRSRETASPPESRFKCYAKRVEGAENEATMVLEVSRHMLKEYDDDDGGHKKTFKRQFTAFPKDVGFNNTLSAPKPDLVEGLEAEEFRPFPIDTHIPGAVLYKDNPRSVTLPHLAGEWKGPDGNIADATPQSGYDGAALVYARNQALSLVGKPDPPGHAEVRTITTDGNSINFFAHYAAPSDEDGTLEYHQYLYKKAHMDTYQGHKDGRRGLRNEQDHARKQSYALRDQLKEYWRQRRNQEALAPVQDEDDEDEDEAGHESIERPDQPTPPASSKPQQQSQGKASSSHSACSSRAQKRKASLSEESSLKKNVGA